MGDIVVLYARDDARDIPAAIERNFSGLSVWWDKKIVNGDYRSALLRAIESAGCVVPVWSKAAETSTVLHDELRHAVTHGVPILPLRIADCSAPVGYGVFQTTDLLGWSGGFEPGLSPFIDRVKIALRGRARVPRPTHTLDLPSPLFFFSVSSYESKLEPVAALHALDVFQASTLLVSAYDMLPDPQLTGADMRKAHGETDLKFLRLHNCQSRGGLVMLDSGQYERTRKDDSTWNYTRFKNALQEAPHDLALSFDQLSPKGHISEVIKGIANRACRDLEQTGTRIVPILHVPQDGDGEYKSDWFPEIAFKIADDLRPELIAIPERELGSGILARVRTMTKIRHQLDQLYRYVPVHILGTGTPSSIALLTAAGADSFDGLEWCRYVADAQNGTLHHFHHFDFYRYQAALAASTTTANAVSDEKVNFAGKTVFHNLDFYTTWLQRLREALTDERQFVAFLTALLPQGSMTEALASLPSIHK